MSTVVRGEDAEPWVEGRPEQFIGRAEAHHVSEAMGTDQVMVRHVLFQPGARTRPHTHSADQLLYWLEPGIVAFGGGDDQPVAAGEYVLLPANVPHMHGAGPDAPARHISMMRAIDSDFDGAIPDEWRRYREAP